EARHNHLTRSSIQPSTSIVGIHPTTKLKPAREYRQRQSRRLTVASPKLNHVATLKFVLLVEFGEPGRWFVRNVVLPGPVICQRASDNLFHASFVEIDARSKQSHELQ